MARTKTAPGTAPTAAHAAPDPAPAPGTAPAADSPTAAVHAALAANPGSTVAAIADALGTGKAVVRDSLLGMEKAGTATRVKGARPGIPDTWTLAEPAPDAAVPAAEVPQAGQPGDPGQDPAGSQDDAGEDETAEGTGQDRTAEAGDAPSPEAGDAEAGETAEPEPRDDAPADDDPEDAAPGEPDDGAEPGGDPDDGDAPDEDAPPDADAGSGGEPDPALVTDLTERLGQIRIAADEAERVLTASGDLKTVLAGMDEIYEQAAQARRALKAATSGRKAPAVRPGGLRDKVLAHLVEHPDKEFTPHEIHKVNGHSSGAIANALDTLVKLGQAEVATEKPRKFRLAAQPAEAAPETAPEAGSADGTDADGTELAGAA